MHVHSLILTPTKLLEVVLAVTLLVSQYADVTVDIMALAAQYHTQTW